MDKRLQAFQEPGKHDHCLFIKAYSCKPDGPIALSRKYQCPNCFGRILKLIEGL